MAGQCRPTVNCVAACGVWLLVVLVAAPPLLAETKPPQPSSVLAIEIKPLRPLLDAAFSVAQELLSNGVESYVQRPLWSMLRGRAWAAYYDPPGRRLSEPVAGALSASSKGESIVLLDFDAEPGGSTISIDNNIRIATRQSMSGKVLAGMTALAVEQLLLGSATEKEEHAAGALTIRSSRARGGLRRWVNTYVRNGSQLFLSSSATHLQQILNGALRQSNDAQPALEKRATQQLAQPLQRLRPSVHDYPMRVLVTAGNGRLQRYLRLLERHWGINLFLHKQQIAMLGLALSLRQSGALIGSLEIFPVHPSQSWAVNDDAGIIIDLVRRRFLDDRFRLTSSVTTGSGTEGSAASQVSFVLEKPAEVSWEELLRSVVGVRR